MAPALGLNPILPASKGPMHNPPPTGCNGAMRIDYGDVKYPAGFKRFDYVNPDAPKGGTLRLFELGTFDNFNIVVKSLKGSIADGSGADQQTLTAPVAQRMTTALWDARRSRRHPDDFSYVIYRLSPAARWHDGKPVTPADVVFSFDALKKYSPRFRAYYRHIVKCERVGDRDVRFSFVQPGQWRKDLDRRRNSSSAEHWWEATEAKAQTRRHGDDAGDSAGVGGLSHQGVFRGPDAGAGTG